MTTQSGDYTLDERLVAEWHQMPEDGRSLAEYMRLTSKEYRAWVEHNVLPLDFEERHATSQSASPSDHGDQAMVPKALADQLYEALRLTQEWVGDEVLPAISGWSWYDAMTAYEDWREAQQSTSESAP